MKNNVASAFIKSLPLALLLLAHPAKAQSTLFFLGTEDARWSLPGNWEGGSLPGVLDAAGINANAPTTSLVDTSFDVGWLSISGSAARTVSISEGSTLRLHGVDSNLIRHVGRSNQTISGAGELQLNSGGFVHVEELGRALAISVAITDGPGSSSGITKTGAGLLNLLVNATGSTFSGGFHLKEGIVASNISSSGSANAPTSGPFGTGVLTLEGGEFRYTGSSSSTVYHNAVAITGDFQFGSATTSYRSFRLTGDIDLNNGTRTITFHQDVVADGVISNGALIKRGPSTLTLSAEQAYTGTTSIESGTLRLTGSGSLASSGEVAIHAGATLEVANSYRFASGQILSGDGRLTGTFRPGASTVIEVGGAGETGELSLEGDTLLDGGDFRFEISSAGHDQLRLAGEGLTLTGNTTGAVQISLIDLDGTASIGDYLLISTSELIDSTLVDWTLASFTLADLPTGWNGSLWLDESGLSFRAIPEPQTVLLVLGGAALLIVRRRFKAWFI